MRIGDRLARVIALVVTADGPAGELHQRVCSAGVAALPVTGASVSVVTGDGGSTIHATDEVAGRLSDLQHTIGEGPMRDALADGRPVLGPELDAAAVRRWPVFVPAAQELKVGAVFAFPLQMGALRLGVLQLHRDVPGALQGDDLDDALTFADAATLTLLHGPDATQEDLDDWARQLVGAQSVVHQAAGMLVAQLGVDIETAFVRMRAHAFVRGRSVHDIARDIVARRLRLRDEDAAP